MKLATFATFAPCVFTSGCVIVAANQFKAEHKAPTPGQPSHVSVSVVILFVRCGSARWLAGLHHQVR